MRVTSIAVALIVALIGASGIRAAVRDADPVGAPLALAPHDAGAALGDRQPPQAPSSGMMQLAQKIDTPPTWKITSGNPVVVPFKWAGFLNNATATKNNPNGWGCTAQFIRPNLLLTAGHCLVDLTSGVPLVPPDPSKITFLLQYQNSETTQAFKAVCAAVSPGWTLPANYNSMQQAQQIRAQNDAVEHDFGLVLVNGTSPTGYMKYMLDWRGKFNYAVRIGYPENILGGAVVQHVGGAVFFAASVPSPFTDYPNLVMHWGPITDATHGMSGGAWVANFDEDGGDTDNVAIGVSSSFSNAFPGGMLAAYLTATEFNPLLNFVSNGCK